MRNHLALSIVAALGATTFSLGAAEAQPAATARATAKAPACADVVVVGVDGRTDGWAGPEAAGPEVRAFTSAFVSKATDRGADVTVRHLGHRFAAASMLVRSRALNRPASASVSKTRVKQWRAGVRPTKWSLVNGLDEMARDCPSQRYVLVGFSQGASSVHRALSAARSRSALSGKITGAVLISDGNRVPHTRATIVGNPAAPAAGKGILTRIFGAAPDVPELSSDPEVFSVCNQGDIVCDLGPSAARKSISAHASYASAASRAVLRGLAEHFAQRSYVPETAFTVASYNVLGSHLTGPGSSKPRFAPGPVRMRKGLAKVEAAGVSVMVLNEFETPQADVVLADGDWSLHRATPNNRFRNGNSGGNAIAWRSDTWSLVEATEFTVSWKINLYMPVVTLEHRETGARITVIGVHNPASTGKQGNQAASRNRARATEIAQIRAIREADPETEVVFAGDMNERAEAFCGFTGTGMLQSSAGGSVGSPCRVPPHGPVDWIFGTLGMKFQGQYIDRSFKGSISDHPLVRADVLLPARQG